MAHEIMEHDNLVLAGEPAWHGLGRVYPDAKTPMEALELALPWEPEQRRLYTFDSDGNRILVETHVANYRSDTEELLGIVSSNWEIVGNRETAEFCEALLSESEGEVLCESVGSIRNGKRIWFLLRGESFQVVNEDEIFPYILVSNGYDGGTSFRVTPTTVRVVCSNTMHMVVPDGGDLCGRSITIYHTVNVKDRIEQVREALSTYGQTVGEFRDVVDRLAAKDVSHEDVQSFFLECYVRDFGDIPNNPSTKVEENRRNRAMDAFGLFAQRFDDEREIAGTTMWNAVNAYSWLIQHGKKARGSDDADRVEKRVNSNLFGLNQARSLNALKTAFSLVS